MSKKVYLIRAAQFYKIGISHNITKRLGAVQTGCPIKCEYVGYFPSSSPEQLEKDLHLAFQDFKTWGEWFDLGDDNIRKLITDWNLKHVVNPYAETTQETERTTASRALQEARDTSAQVNAIDRLYSEHFPGRSINDIMRSKVRKLIIRYGFDVVSTVLNHLASYRDKNEALSFLPNGCKQFSQYGRHIPVRVWKWYMKIKQFISQEDATWFVDYTMTNNLEDDEEYMRCVELEIADRYDGMYEDNDLTFQDMVTFFYDEREWSLKHKQAV